MPAAAKQAAPPRADLIRGAVTTDSGKPLRAVTVIATMAPDRTVQQAVTDSTGHYTIRFERGTGDYLIYAAPLGYRAFRRRVTRAPGQTDIVVDIKLVAEATLLGGVNTSAPRPRALPDGGLSPDPTGLQQGTNGLLGALSPDQRGYLNALAQTIPGITAAADGSIVAFGLPGQVTTTFNGMALGASSIPADVMARVRVTTAAYDPSIGGFGGANINVVMAQGGSVPSMFVRTTLDAPALQYASPAASRLGQPFAALTLDGNASGQLPERDLFYNTGVQVRRRSADAPSLLGAQADVLGLAGVSPDSIARLQQLALAQGIALTRAGIPSSRVNQNATVLLRVDHYADPRRTGKLWTNEFSATTLLSLNSVDAPGSGPTTAPSAGQASRSGSGQVLGSWLHIADNFSSELTSSLTGSRSSGDPYESLPAARVRIASQLDGSTPTTSAVTLGGLPSSNAASGGSWEAIGALHFYVGSAHKMKVYGRSMIDAASTSSLPNTFGSYTYNSLADFANNLPASFTRSLNTPSASAGAWRGAMSVGDLWQLTPSFQLQPGVRLEANHFLTTPSANPAVSSAFGMSNTNVPNTIHVSPRIGFAWTYARTLSFATGGGALGVISLPPRGFLSGGIGEFRNDISSGALLGPLAATGLSNGATQLACVGAAVPLPNWRSFDANSATIPTQCAGGAEAAFSDVAPVVQFFDANYRLPRSWRGNVQWGSAYKSLHYAVSAVYSYNIDQPGLRDLNLSSAPQFTLANEGGRPVFASASSIVPGSGVVSPVDARRTPSLGPVLARVSDLHSTSRQATITVAPEFDRAILSVNYTLSDIRGTTRGFDGSTFASPSELETARSASDVRHNIMISTGYRWSTGIGASLYWNIFSGIPYTPLVATDVNGDGRANDRAFIFDPARATDAAVANGMRSLLASASSQARDCLSRQLGRAAGSNSCEGPWTSSMNASIATNSFHVLDGRLATIELNLANPLAGVDQAVHGSDNLHGWGVPAFADRTLFTVRGFDPAASQFLYAVNPRFGSTRPSENTFRAPFRATLSARIELGTPVQQKNFTRFKEMNPVRLNHAPAPVDSLASRLADIVSDSYKLLLRNRDSLLITAAQADSITAADKAYTTRADSVWRDVARYIDASRDGYDLQSITRHVDAAAVRVWAIQREEIPRIMSILVPAQQELAKIMLKFVIESGERPRNFTPF